jgi:four helix bundle protein
MFSLTSQMKRATDSISLNIAEGSTGPSDLEQSRFIGYSQRSALEVVNCLYLAIKRSYIDQSQFDFFYKRLEVLIVKIQAFRNSIKNN